ncbi:3-oxoacyl-[acyl-carrier-protein] reductase FabG [Halotydeus destructor]|nr:3-oxoacyl-[acyl-carrier-protein] reductase FabG [Halotydeus destructor]
MEHEDVATLVTKTIEAFGRIDVLVNNAAMFELCFLDSKLFEAIFDNFTQMNLKSVLMLTRAAAPHLLKTKGCVINVSGLASTMPAAGWLAASCTKAAIDIATKTLAKELKGVRVNCIAPAIIHTPLTDRLGDKETVDALLAETSRRYPIGRHGVPQDTSDVILFLASSRASFLTGVILPVAGGADLLGLGVE